MWGGDEVACVSGVMREKKGGEVMVVCMWVKPTDED